MGLARFEQAVAGSDELTLSGYVMGSVDYMSPEQGYDMKGTDQRSDVYGLGCTLWYLLTGRPLFEGETLVQKVLAHREHPVPALQAVRSDVSQNLDAVFHRMVAKKPPDRQQSMTQVIAELQSCGFSAGQRGNGLPGVLAAADDAADGQQTRPLSTGPAPISSLIEEWLLEEPAVLSEPWLAPTWRSVRRRIKQRRLWILLGVLASVFLAWIIVNGIPPWRSLTGDRERPTPPPDHGGPPPPVAPEVTDGILVVVVNEPRATVQVYEDHDNLVNSRVGDSETVSLLVGPGKYHLRVEKVGFRTFTQDFSIEPHQRLQLNVTLEPARGKTPNP